MVLSHGLIQRRRSEAKVSQMGALTVAGPGAKCRRWVFFGRPATQIGHRKQKPSQVTQKMQTCDGLLVDLRRAGP